MVKKLNISIGIFGFFFFSSLGYAEGMQAPIVDYYSLILHRFHVESHDFVACLAGLFTLLVITSIGLRFRSTTKSSDPSPHEKFDLQTLVESLLDFVHQLAADIIGKDSFKKFFSLLSTIFLFIFISNCSGLVPGFPPATESIDTNLAMAIVIFLVYNWAGIREHGFGYAKHFLGPIWWLAPLMLVIEIISHIARPVSLSLRLYGNIFGDHLVLSVFTGLTWIIMPAFLLFFGLLVAFVQSFVFTLLSSIYIAMAVSHDH